ncbi:MAG: DUF4293 domain-containing protein [Muribaculaceae bacterium]|nr:DUF4293 domain-containing protein [Muribaculaceae bacterium]
MIATVLMALFAFLPFASVAVGPLAADLCPKDFPVYLILNLLIAILLFIAIFMYKNLKLQKKVTLLSMVLICCSAVTGGFLLYGPNAPKGVVALEWGGGVLLLIGALVFALLAYRGIGKDQRTLSSYDRIR